MAATVAVAAVAAVEAAMEAVAVESTRQQEQFSQLSAPATFLSNSSTNTFCIAQLVQCKTE